MRILSILDSFLIVSLLGLAILRKTLETVGFGSGCYAKYSSVNSCCIRLSLGDFRTSPANSLLCESGMLPLCYRREKQIKSFAMKILSNPDHFLYILLFITHLINCTYKNLNLRNHILLEPNV